MVRQLLGERSGKKTGTTLANVPNVVVHKNNLYWLFFFALIFFQNCVKDRQ